MRTLNKLYIEIFIFGEDNKQSSIHSLRIYYRLYICKNICTGIHNKNTFNKITQYFIKNLKIMLEKYQQSLSWKIEYTFYTESDTVLIR